MAVPSFTAINPDQGHPGGSYHAVITGTDFQIATPPTADGFIGEDFEPSMEVELDGRLAEDVRVWSATKLTARIPSYRNNPEQLETGLLVDLLLRNLGPPTEEVTTTDAFTYKRTNLARPGGGILNHVIKTLILEMRRQIIQNVVTATQVDYDDTTGDTLSIIAMAEVPGIAVFGPSLRENKTRRYIEPNPENRDIGSLSYTKYKQPFIYDLLFEATIIVQDSIAELIELCQEFMLFFRRNAYLAIDTDSTDPSIGITKLDMFLTDGPSRQGSATEEGHHSATASFGILAIPIDEDEWLPIEYGTILDDPADVTIDVQLEE